MLNYYIGDIIDNKDIINTTEEKQKQSLFVSDFKKLNKSLSPIIAEFIQNENISLSPTLFFFASLVKEIINDIDDEDKRKRLLESVTLFILDK